MFPFFPLFLALYWVLFGWALDFPLIEGEQWRCPNALQEPTSQDARLLAQLTPRTLVQSLYLCWRWLTSVPEPGGCSGISLALCASTSLFREIRMNFCWFFLPHLNYCNICWFWHFTELLFVPAVWQDQGRMSLLCCSGSTGRICTGLYHIKTLILMCMIASKTGEACGHPPFQDETLTLIMGQFPLNERPSWTHMSGSGTQPGILELSFNLGQPRIFTRRSDWVHFLPPPSL